MWVEFAVSTLGFAIVLRASGPCYWRDGTSAFYGSLGYTPCMSNGVSMCCVFANGDTCTSQGFCQNIYGLYRDACTDPTWSSPNCSAVCPTVTNTFSQLTTCPDGSFCCESDLTCCDQGRGVNVTTVLVSNTTVPTSTATSTSSPTPTSITSALNNPKNAWHYIITNAWLATPIVAAIGWCNMWLVGALMACSKGMDSGFVADRRYTGLIKRTCMAAFLADADTAHPKQVIDMVTMDPGLSSQLDNLDYCDTGKVAYLSWVIQLGATFYAIFLALYVWGSDNSVKNFTASVQFPLMLGVLNINRGTWAIAVIGCCLPGRGEKKVKWLMGTTVLALMTDWLFISRAFEMAWHINQQLPPRWLGILSWVLPGVESFIFFAGLIAGYKKISYMGPWVLPMIPAAFWLALGPLFIIAISVMSHFNPNFLDTMSSPLQY